MSYYYFICLNINNFDGYFLNCKPEDRYYNFLQIFLTSCKEPYRSIDKVHQELQGFQDILIALNKSSALFNIQPPDDKNLKQCQRELKLAKVCMILLHIYV